MSTEGYEEMEKYLKSLDPVTIDAIVTAYKSFSVYDKLIADRHPCLDSKSATIMMCIAHTGCYYDGEIDAALRCLRQNVKLYQSKDVRFSPHNWEALCTVEAMFGTITS